MVVYYRPDTLAEALALRAKADLTVLSGGTDVYPAKAARAGWGDMAHTDVLDISAVAGLKGIVEQAACWRLGALTTWTDLIEADLPPLFAGYQRAAREIGGVQIQNCGTLVGNICTASPAGDGAPNLLALEAEVELASLGGTRRVEMAAFIDGYRHTACRSDEIVTAIRIPKRARRARGHFRKLGARKYLVISIAMVAAVIETDAAGTIAACRLVVGACSAVPLRLTALEAALTGVPLATAGARVTDQHLSALSPIDDIRASAAYRRAAALALTRDLLADLADAQAGRAA
jgi:N-methylhydantoinase B